MKFRTRLFSLLLSGVMALSLCACSNSPDAEPSSSPADFTVDTSVEDLTLATTGIPGDTELFTINGIPVTARFYAYWLAYDISYLESYYGTLDFTSNESLAGYLKEDALDAAAQYTLVAAKAKELGYELTEEQINELDSSMAMAQIMMGGEEAFNDELRKIGLDYDSFYSINANSYYYNNLQDGLFAGRPTEDEVTSYIEDNDILYAKHILLFTIDPDTNEALDAAAIAQQKATAEDLLKQLQESDDLLTDFDTLMNEYSEDSGLAYYPDGYTFTAGEMVEEFESATRALEYGQLSGIVESPYGYHIILRLDPATDSFKAEFRADLLYTQLTTWLDEAEIVTTEAYDALDVTDYYSKLTAYQKAFAAEQEAAEGTDEEAGESTDEKTEDDAAEESTN